MYKNLLTTLQYTIKANRYLIFGVFLSLGLLSAVFIWNMFLETRENVESRLLAEAENRAFLVNSAIHQAENVLLTISQSYGVQTQNSQMASDFLRRVSVMLPNVLALNVADLKGYMFAKTDPKVNLNVTDRPFFKGALQNKGLFVTDGLISVVDDKPIIVVSMPVRNQDGEIFAVAYAILTLEELNKTLQIGERNQQENLYLIDSQGVTLAHSNWGYITDQRVQIHLVELKKQMGSQKGVTSLYNPLDGKRDLVAYYPIEGTGWTMAVKTPLKVVYANMMSELLPSFLLFVVMATPTLVIIWLFLIKLSEQQKQLRQNNEVLSKLAITDGLTGLYNHRYFQEKLEKYILQARQEKQHVTLIMLDIDYFKHFNDNYGHLAGDMVLKTLATVLTDKIGDMGMVARYGGEEFAIILRNHNSKEGLVIAEEVRSIVENYSFQGIEGLKNGEVTISVGLASFPEHASHKDDLVRLADQALYKAKFTAKNKVEVYYSVLDDLKTHLNTSEQNLLSSIKTLITVINAKDKYTYGHSERVLELAVALGQELGLNLETLNAIKYGAYIHDIGKIEIDRDILNKPGPLTEEEYKIIKEHPGIGAEIVQPVESLKKTIPIIRYHHEWYNGVGYPQGLKGEEIPLEARIVAVVDSYDAMTTDRPYKKGKSVEEALLELERCSGIQFDPVIVEVFIGLINKKEIAC